MGHLGRWAVILFCCWHMTAVLAVTIPDSAASSVAIVIRGGIQPIVRPYINWTTQWQMWDLFSPNPSNWITEARMEALVGSSWILVRHVAPETVSIWRQADEFKIQQRMEQEDGQPQRARALQLLCVEENIPEGTPVRMMLTSRYLNRDEAIPHASDWIENETALIYCPARL